MEISDASRRDDGELVRAALDGSEVAFRELVRRYQDSLYRHAERMTGRSDDAEDIVQAAFVKAYHSLRSCRQPDRIGGWLFRICANACKDHQKAKRRAHLSLDQVPALAAEGGNPEAALDRTDMREAIDLALAELAPDQREAFLLKHIEGRSYDEMSELLGVSVPALKMRVHRAREELQDLLESYRR